MLSLCISQTFIMTGYALFFWSRFRIDKNSILMTDTASRICFVIGYYLIDSINGIPHTVYVIIRNIIG